MLTWPFHLLCNLKTQKRHKIALPSVNNRAKSTKRTERCRKKCSRVYPVYYSNDIVTLCDFCNERITANKHTIQYDTYVLI